jgi:hypothetical protein
MARRVGVESLSGGDAGACGGETFFWWGSDLKKLSQILHFQFLSIAMIK